MPPKKKGKVASPIVVGTVSTRSTRRQSVVNIEIPKSKARKGKRSNEAVKTSQGSVSLNILNTGKKLSDKCKVNYNKDASAKNESKSFKKMLSKSESELSLSVQSQKTHTKSSKKVFGKSSAKIQSNKALLQILEDWSDGESQDTQRGTSGVDSSDDSDSYKNKDFKNLEFGAEDISKIIGENYTICKSTECSFPHKQSTNDSIKEIEQTLISEKHYSLNETSANEKEKMKNKNILEIVNENLTENTNDKLVQGPVEEAITYENEVVFECVAEEVVPSNMGLASTISVEETSILTEFENSQDGKEIQVVSTNVIHQEQINVLENVNEETRQSISTNDSTDSEVRKFFAREIEKNESVKEENISQFDKDITENEKVPININTETVIVENRGENSDNIQRVSVSEHCEELIESEDISPKEIINNEQLSRNCELKPEDEEIGSSMNGVGSQKNEVEESLDEFIETEEIFVAQEIEEMVVEEVVGTQEIEISDEKDNETLNVIHSPDYAEKPQEYDQIEEHIEFFELKNVNPQAENQLFEEISSQEDLQKIESEETMEISVMNDNQPNEEKEVVPKKSLNETVEKELVENNDTEAGLEEKVAELNITETGNFLEEAIIEKVAELNLQVLDVKENKNAATTNEITGNLEKSLKKAPKPVRTQKTKNADSKIVSKNKKTKSSKTITSKSVKTLKVQAKNLKEKKGIQPRIKPQDAKLKDTKVCIKPSKESKTKKKTISISPTKKGKDIHEKKSSEILDQKDKKTLKTDSDKEKAETDSEDLEVRRSSRIKSISILKKKTTGHGLVRSKSEPQLNESDTSDNNSTVAESERGTPSASPKIIVRERKTRWSKSTEHLPLESSSMISTTPTQEMSLQVYDKPKLLTKDPVIDARLKQFVHLKENAYKTDRMVCKEAKTMMCDCFLTTQEISANEYGCGEDCLNRLLLIECGNLCQVGDRCTNKRFQKVQFAPVEVFNTEKKGLGLRAAANIPFGEFILEYVGEVLDIDEFDKRAEVYSEDKNTHYYFMALRADAIIDATMKGNISRFINHSCDPNAETQKWTVNGELRIGFFSTRTILAGEEITFDYRFQRYGKEAQKCYCGAAICKGWLGEQPDSEEDDEEDDEEEEEEEQIMAPKAEVIPVEINIEIPKSKAPSDLVQGVDKVEIEDKSELVELKELKVETVEKDIKPPSVLEDAVSEILPAAPVTVEIPIKVKKKGQKKKLKPRIEILEEIDQLNEEIEMLVTTGLKNQAHTLKLSRLMVRAKEPQQRTKLLRVLRRGELPCRRLFLDYHGLRLMHGYMIDAQLLVVSNKKFESVRLEMLQTLAVLPIPNRTMLQDSKVLSTVEKWASSKDLTSPGDSDSNSPKPDHDISNIPKPEAKIEKVQEAKNEESVPKRSVEEQEEEIRFLANKLLEEWRNLKEVFRIPKKERIEQMKEHEKEANRKFMQSSYAVEHDKERKSDRYRILSKFKVERDTNKRPPKPGEKYSAEFMKLSKIERRKLFALQQELKEEERRLKQRELWRQHEMNCMMIGTDPRFTAPFDPSKPYQLIWNPQLGQWQTYPLPQNPHLLTPQPQIPNLNIPPPQLAKSMPYQYTPPMNLGASMGPGMPQLQPTAIPQITAMPVLPSGITPNLSHPPGQVQLAPSSIAQMNPINAINSIQSSLHQNLPTHTQTQVQLSPVIQSLHGSLAQNLPPQPPVPSNIPGISMPAVQYQEPKPNKEEDPSKVKFMGPIPPPVKLPPKWKCAKDKYGRPYYYHIKNRNSQWEPPPLVSEPPVEEQEESSESESSSDTSSTSSDTSSENSESEEEIDDTKLLLAVRRQMETTCKLQGKSTVPEHIKTEEPLIATPSPEEEQCNMEIEESTSTLTSYTDEDMERPSIDIRLKEQFNFKDDKPPKKKRRVGLCEEILIEPRSEEDKLQAKEDLKRYKANKEKLKRQKELILQQTKKQLREIELKKSKEKSARTSLKAKMKEMPEFNKEVAKKIKEAFRNNMASTVVNTLNNYRKPDCKEGKITNTEDFKHLARKLTHFVMLKEMKHISRIEELTCTDNVKMKAREYIRKYMSKFGEVYIKRSDSPEFKD